MRLTGNFYEDMEAIQEEYASRMASYSCEQWKLHTGKQYKRYEKLAKLYFDANEKMKRVLKFINTF